MNIRKLKNIVKKNLNEVYFSKKVIARYRLADSFEVYNEDEVDWDYSADEKKIKTFRKGEVIDIVGHEEGTGETFFKLKNKIYGTYDIDENAKWVSGKKIDFSDQF